MTLGSLLLSLISITILTFDPWKPSHPDPDYDPGPDPDPGTLTGKRQWHVTHVELTFHGGVGRGKGRGRLCLANLTLTLTLSLSLALARSQMSKSPPALLSTVYTVHTSALGTPLLPPCSTRRRCPLPLPSSSTPAPQQLQRPSFFTPSLLLHNLSYFQCILLHQLMFKKLTWRVVEGGCFSLHPVRRQASCKTQTSDIFGNTVSMGGKSFGTTGILLTKYVDT